MQREVAIKLENVNKTFTIRDKSSNAVNLAIKQIFSPGKLRKIKALKDINLEVYKGEFLGIVGANGSGKSTLLHLMSGV